MSLFSHAPDTSLSFRRPQDAPFLCQLLLGNCRLDRIHVLADFRHDAPVRQRFSLRGGAGMQAVLALPDPDRGAALFDETAQAECEGWTADVALAPEYIPLLARKRTQRSPRCRDEIVRHRLSGTGRTGNYIESSNPDSNSLGIILCNWANLLRPCRPHGNPKKELSVSRFMIGV